MFQTWGISKWHITKATLAIFAGVLFAKPDSYSYIVDCERTVLL